MKQIFKDLLHLHIVSSKDYYLAAKFTRLANKKYVVYYYYNQVASYCIPAVI